ncbi:MAG: hypothetical protein JST68_27235 [Bacteroidetes bacterium]|nr:hypothetical protein [Bacteroidota bacterium]
MKKNFTFEKEQLNYEIQLRRKRRWWWLLLLLLPLLLLIRLNKDVYVKTVDAGSHTPIPGTAVTFQYNKRFLYDRGRFFTNEAVRLDKIADSTGTASFIHLQYSVYSLIFGGGSNAIVYAASNKCYTSDTIITRFHGLRDGDTLTLPMHALFTELDFKVIDKDDLQPLPDASVRLITEVSGMQYFDSAVTDPNGKVIFTHFPRCGRLVKLVASLDGYYPDSIMNHTTEELFNNVGNIRLLPLKPIKKPIEFFVVDCKTGAPVAGASATINFDYNGRKIPVKRTTNLNGVGKGYYEDAYAISKLHISASKPGYKDGELAGWHPVPDFINYPRERRTFCLMPEEHPAPCTAPPHQAGSTDDVASFDMKNPELKFFIDYEMYTEPDGIVIYCGKDTTGAILYETSSRVSGQHRADIDMKKCGGSTWITVKIISNKTFTDAWKYWFVCP